MYSRKIFPRRGRSNPYQPPKFRRNAHNSRIIGGTHHIGSADPQGQDRFRSMDGSLNV